MDTVKRVLDAALDFRGGDMARHCKASELMARMEAISRRVYLLGYYDGMERQAELDGETKGDDGR